MTEYDVIIIGAGPAGLFAAYELSPKKKIALIDAGLDIKDKECPIETKGKCAYCKPVCNIMGGFGGAQFFEGTKLSIYPAGSGIVKFCGNIERAQDIYRHIDSVLEENGKRPRQYPDEEAVETLKSKFSEQGIEMKYYNAQKASKNDMNVIAGNLKEKLIKTGVDIILGTHVKSIERYQDGTFILHSQNGTYKTKTLALAVGRLGSRWLSRIADDLGIDYDNETHEMEIGVRIEMPASVFANIDDVHNDLKLKKRLNENEELRTFCQDYRGFITKCVYNLPGDKVISSLDGHIIGTEEAGGAMSDVVNLAVHHRYKINGNLDSSYDLVNKMSLRKKPLIQSMKNFMENKDETNEFSTELSMPDVQEANINDYLPERTLQVLKEFIEDIDKTVPGFANPKNTVYAPSFEKGWKQYHIDLDQETNVKGIYILGDASGHFRGIMQAMASGTLFANSILTKH